jgi:hypothetical protein
LGIKRGYAAKLIYVCSGNRRGAIEDIGANGEIGNPIKAGQG